MPSPSTWSRISGGIVLALVVSMYAMAWMKGGWPPSHPWSGIALTFLGVRAMIWPVEDPRRVVILSGLALAAAVLWTVSAM